MTTDLHPVAGPDREVTLDIAGMTCASCAQRIERKLNKLDGVTATVNYATEKARVRVPGTVSTDDLLADGRAPPGTPPRRCPTYRDRRVRTPRRTATSSSWPPCASAAGRQRRAHRARGR